MPQVGQLQPKHLPAYGSCENHQPCSGFTWEGLGVEKKPVMKEMLRRHLHNKPFSEKQGQFSFGKVVCNGEGQESSHPGGLAQEMPPTLTPSFRTKTQEVPLEHRGEKELFLQLKFQNLWIQQGTRLHWWFNGTRALFSFSVCLGLW